MDDLIKKEKVKDQEIPEKGIEHEQVVGVEEEAKDDCEEKLKDLEVKLAEEKDLRLRALADYQNLKNRFAKEKEELVTFSQSILLLKVLELTDDFKNVIEAHPNDGVDDDTWISGVKMVYEKLKDIIKSEGVEIVLVQSDEVFNPAMHEAIGFVYVTNPEEDGKISNVVNNGYKKQNSDKLIRSAKVIVKKLQS